MTQIAIHLSPLSVRVRVCVCVKKTTHIYKVISLTNFDNVTAQIRLLSLPKDENAFQRKRLILKMWMS